jgi:hypothetical protein
VLHRKEDSTAVSGSAALLAQARARLRRLEPWEAAAALEAWAALVDIRPAAERAVEGEIPGALVIERACWSGALTQRARTGCRWPTRTCT